MKLTEQKLLRAIGEADEKMVEKTAPDEPFESLAAGEFVPERAETVRRPHRIVGGLLTAAAAAACIAAVIFLPRIGKEEPSVADTTAAVTTTAETADTTLSASETTETTETTEEPDVYPEFAFEIKDGKAYLTESYDYLRKSVIIPETYKGVPVVGIDGQAFRDAYLEEIILPESLVSIGYGAFMDCEHLKSISIPDSVTSIDNCAFIRCTALENVRLPEKLTRVGSYAFDSTPWLERKTAENPLVIVNGILLLGCECTGEVVIPDGTVMIADSAFRGGDYDYDKYGDVDINTLLTSVICPPSLKVIGENAFMDCVHLKSVTLSEGLERIEKEAFFECYDLESVSIPASVKEISDGNFSYCGTDTQGNDSEEKLTIRGKAGSYAETYAKENKLHFQAE